VPLTEWIAAANTSVSETALEPATEFHQDSDDSRQLPNFSASCETQAAPIRTLSPSGTPLAINICGNGF
jgi:hypothetical protein